MRAGVLAAVVVQLKMLRAALGLIVPAMTSALLGSVDRTRSGVASGTLNTARQTGSVIGVALFGAFAATSVVSGLRLSLITAAALALLTAAVAVRLPGRQSVSTPSTRRPDPRCFGPTGPRSEE